MPGFVGLIQLPRISARMDVADIPVCALRCWVGTRRRCLSPLTHFTCTRAHSFRAATPVPYGLLATPAVRALAFQTF